MGDMLQPISYSANINIDKDSKSYACQCVDQLKVLLFKS